MTRMKLFIILGAINAFITVALGAFGAHGLEGKVSERMLAIWEKAVKYQMFHTLGLFIIAWLSDKMPTLATVSWAGWCMVIGILLFSGSLYIYSTTGIKTFAMITPIGGMFFLVSWVFVLTSAIRGL